MLFPYGQRLQSGLEVLELICAFSFELIGFSALASPSSACNSRLHRSLWKHHSAKTFSYDLSTGTGRPPSKHFHLGSPAAQSLSDVRRLRNVNVLLFLMRRHGNIDMKRISSLVSGMLPVPLWPGAWQPVPCLSGAEEPRARPQQMYQYLTGAEMGCAPCSSVARVAPGSVQPQRSLFPPSDLQPRQ